MLMRQYYKNSREAKQGIKLFRTAIAALVERDEESAIKWLERDSLRAAEAGRTNYDASLIAAKQLSLETGEPVGENDKSAKEYQKLAKEDFASSSMSRQAAVLVPLGVDVLNGHLDWAMKQVAKLTDDEADERKKKAQSKREKAAA